MKKDFELFKSAVDVGADKDIPKTLEEYEKLKYTNPKEFDELNAYARSVHSGKIAPVATFAFYKQVRREVEEKLYGKTTAAGIVIQGQSYHLTERMIGTTEKDAESGDIRLGVTVDELEDV